MYFFSNQLVSSMLQCLDLLSEEAIVLLVMWLTCSCCDLIITTTLIPDKAVFMLASDDRQIGFIQKKREGILPVQSQSRTGAIAIPDLGMLEHCSGETRPFSSLFFFASSRDSLLCLPSPIPSIDGLVLFQYRQ